MGWESTNVTRNWNGSSRAFTPQGQPVPFRNRSTAITSRGGRLVPERLDAVEQVWTRAPGCVPVPEIGIDAFQHFCSHIEKYRNKVLHFHDLSCIMGG